MIKVSDDLAQGLKHYRNTFIIKRIFDIILSIFVLTLFLIPGIIICIFIVSDGGPAFFAQERVGYNGKIFNIYKLRSMKQGSELLEKKLLQASDSGFVQREGDERVTAIGRFLRKTSIDEIPQFFNVLRGDMSIIGPRPLIALETSGLAASYQQRNLVVPGISGLAQLKRNRKITIEETCEEDLKYIRDYSLFLDIKIVFSTAFVFFSGR